MLLSEGHTQARRYPLAFLWSEARIARQRINNRAVQDALVMQAVIGTILDKKGPGNLRKLLKEIENSD